MDEWITCEHEKFSFFQIIQEGELQLLLLVLPNFRPKSNKWNNSISREKHKCSNNKNETQITEFIHFISITRTWERISAYTKNKTMSREIEPKCIISKTSGLYNKNKEQKKQYCYIVTNCTN